MGPEFLRNSIKSLECEISDLKIEYVGLEIQYRQLRIEMQRNIDASTEKKHRLIKMYRMISREDGGYSYNENREAAARKFSEGLVEIDGTIGEIIQKLSK